MTKSLINCASALKTELNLDKWSLKPSQLTMLKDHVNDSLVPGTGQLTKDQLSSKLKDLKGQYAEYKRIADASGAGAGGNNHIFGNEAWAEFIKDKPHLAKWRYESPIMYPTLDEIFREGRASGGNALSSSELGPSNRNEVSFIEGEGEGEGSSVVGRTLPSSEHVRKEQIVKVTSI